MEEGGGGEAWSGEAVSAGVWVGSRRLVPFSSRMSIRSSSEWAWLSVSFVSWEGLRASSLVWACCSTIVSREFGLIGCARDEDIIWLGGCARDKDLVGVEMGFGSEGF